MSTTPNRQFVGSADVLNKGADDPDYEVFQVLPADGVFRDRIILKRKTTPLTKPVRKSYT